MSGESQYEGRIYVEHELRMEINRQDRTILELQYQNSILQGKLENVDDDTLFVDLNDTFSEECMDVSQDILDEEYIKAAFRYLTPTLLSEDDKTKLRFAGDILKAFSLKTMDGYKRLAADGIIGIECVDRRIKERDD